MDSANIKRMILAESEATGIRRKILNDPENGINNDDVLEMGDAFETMVKTKAWAYIESYIINRANPVALVFEPGENQVKKGIAQGLMSLMQYVDQMIKAKNELILKAKAERPAEDSLNKE